MRRGWQEAIRRWDLRRRIRAAASSGAFRDVFLTYDNEAHTDGAGAQLHRVLGVFALSRAIGAGYVHTPVGQANYNGVLGSEHARQTRVLERLAAMFELPSDAAPSDAMQHSLPMTHFSLSEARRMAGQGTRVIRVLYPHRYTDRLPDIWDKLDGLRLAPARAPGPFRIALHVRRGDLHVPRLQKRMVPNAYYIEVALQLGRLLTARGIPHQFELHTEAAQPGSGEDQMIVGYKHEVRLTEAHDRLEEFEVLQPLQLRINRDLVETIADLGSADALITSKSSLSFVAALMRSDRAVLYLPFWHAPRPAWLVTRPDGSFDAERLEPFLAAFAARAGG